MSIQKIIQMMIVAVLITGFHCANNINNSCEYPASSSFFSSSPEHCFDYTACSVNDKDPKALEQDCKNVTGANWVSGKCNRTKYPNCQLLPNIGDCFINCNK
ncbi:MAG: hypothetical protein OEV78_12095 [Spirochaetia bacterium]|nr:hypothetical protein [Spirochaetia bacterium]